MYISEAELTLLKIKSFNADITSEMLNDLVGLNLERATKMKQLYDAYCGKTAILNRQFDDVSKLNNKLVSDYRGDIVNTVTGYVFGNPITRQINKTKYPEATYEIAKNTLEDFLIRNNMEDIDAEIGKYASICGYGVKLLYINQDGEEAVAVMKPWKTMFINEASTNRPQFAIFYETRYENDKEYIHLELYDETTVTEYKKYSTAKAWQMVNEYPHMFATIPLIKYKNNDEEQGDFEKVESLIDAYERVVSDVQNEAEELRLAYMLFYGVQATTDVLKQARQTGGFTLDPGNSEKIEYLTKNINSEFIEAHKQTLNDNIYKFAKVIDMSDEKFNAQTGVARRYKLQGLENKAIVKERKFNTADRQMFKCLSLPWATKGVSINYIDIFNTFTRNLPVDLQEDADLIQKLGIKLSQTTGLSLLSFIDDVDYEKEQIKNEQAESQQATQVNQAVQTMNQQMNTLMNTDENI